MDSVLPTLPPLCLHIFANLFEAINICIGHGKMSRLGTRQIAKIMGNRLERDYLHNLELKWNVIPWND